MHKNIELEYKILVDEHSFYELLKEYPNLVFHEQINTYFDTKDHQIRKMHGAMRIRKKDNFIFTLKLPSKQGLLEYECEVEDDSITSLSKKEIQDLLLEHGIQGEFVKLTTLHTKRAVFETDYAQLCFDISSYNGIVDYEIEYEYKQAHDGEKVFNAILNKVNLAYTTNCKSKIQRAIETL